MLLLSSFFHNLSTTTSIVLALFVISAVTWYAWLNRKAQKLPPGPTGLPLVGNLLSLDPELHTYFAGLAHIYGPILKLQLGGKLGIVITSPGTAREVLKDHDTVFANRDVPAAGRAATYGGSDIVWTPYGPEWRMLRKVCVVKMLSHNTLDSVYDLRRKEVRKTVSYLHDREGSAVNVGEQAFLTVMNVVTNMMWGAAVEGAERESLGAEFRELVAEMTQLLGKPNVSDFFPGLARFDLQRVEKEMHALVPRFDKIFESMISQRSELETEERKDFLEFLLKLKDEGGDSKTPLTITHVKALLMFVNRLGFTSWAGAGQPGPNPYHLLHQQLGFLVPQLGAAWNQCASWPRKAAARSKAATARRTRAVRRWGVEIADASELADLVRKRRIARRAQMRFPYGSAVRPRILRPPRLIGMQSHKQQHNNNRAQDRNHNGLK